MTRLLLLPYALIAAVFIAAVERLCQDVPAAVATFDAAIS